MSSKSKTVLSFLDFLTSKNVEYAVIRNFSELQQSQFKDVDLIASQKGADLIRYYAENYFGYDLRLVIGVNRMQITIFCKHEEIQFDVDLVIRITATKHSKFNFLKYLIDEHVVFSMVETVTRSISTYQIRLLSPQYELKLLKNHVRKKPSRKHLERIEKLSSKLPVRILHPKELPAWHINLAVRLQSILVFLVRISKIRYRRLVYEKNK